MERKGDGKERKEKKEGRNRLKGFNHLLHVDQLGSIRRIRELNLHPSNINPVPNRMEREVREVRGKGPSSFKPNKGRGREGEGRRKEEGGRRKEELHLKPLSFLFFFFFSSFFSFLYS